jgi:hypothetical protein
MRYRQPSSLNVITLILLLLAGLATYLVVYLWPVYTASSRANAVLHDYIPALYKANLRSDAVTRGAIEKIKTDISKDLERAGIHDKALKLTILHNPKEISIEARFTVAAHFPFPDKTYDFHLAPKVVSDATRVDW